MFDARARASQAAADASKSAMVSVVGTTVTEAKVRELAAAAAAATNSLCFVSNVLCVGNITVSGSVGACDEVVKVCAHVRLGAIECVHMHVCWCCCFCVFHSITRFKQLGPSYGASKAIKLNVAGAFHSEYMRPAHAQLRKVLEGVVFRAPRIPVVMNVDGLPESDPESIKRKLLDQLVMPVLWERRQGPLCVVLIATVCL